MGCAFLCISLLLLHASAMDTSEKRLNDYGYHFNVTSVDRCPMNISEHEKAEARLGCKETQGYHCIPDKYHSTLIEFCYPKKRILVHTGNCLELADIGILNHVKCQTFSGGCPVAPYYSNEMYKYPVCLSVAFNCFTSDIACLQEKVDGLSVKKFQNDGEKKRIDIFMVLFIIASTCILLVVLVLVFLCIFKRKKMLVFWRDVSKSKRSTSVESDEEDQLSLTLRPRDEGAGGSVDSVLRCERALINTASLTIDQNNHHSIPTAAEVDEVERRPETKCVDPKELPSLILDPGELECEHMLEDMELLLLLRRHCLHGAYENFDYLLTTRILNKENNSLKNILESLDKDGRSLLHYAAKGGSVDILETLSKNCSERNLNDTDNLGHTLLHIACKHERYDICTFLLSKDDNKRSQMNKSSHHQWNAAHFTAACGNSKIFELLLMKKFDMKSKTANGLNILDIACMNNQTSFCKELIERNSELNLPLDKSDARGWNIAHIAAMVGNKDILEQLINGFIDIDVVKSITHYEKTILHICCEHGHYQLCKFIVENEHLKDMLINFDHNRWNALHFCAKGGSLDAFKFIESKKIHELDSKTRDSKTALHISCIHKHVEIAKYICEKLKLTDKNINELKTKTLWTAAHYVAVEIKQDGTEEKLIEILVEAGIDLKAKTEERKTVLTVACEHRNKTLVRYLVKDHPELLKIETDLLKKAAACDAEIKKIIDTALQKHGIK